MITETKNNIDIETYINTNKKLIDEHLINLFKNNKEFSKPKALWEAVEYSLLNGGKRLRAILCLSTFEALNKTNNLKLSADCLMVASTLEIIHAMSLIHDDLPAMDNDDFRRGKPSCHKAFSESTAILAGDAMLTIPFYLISAKCNGLNTNQKLNLVKTLASSTSFGLVPGQILDLSLKDTQCNLSTLEEIYSLKTAELIKTSILCGAIVALENPDEKIFQKLEKFGNNIGIAFQIVDDILDVTADKKTLGKTPGKDQKQKLSTYPKLVGIDNSQKRAKELIEKANITLNELPLINNHLSLLANYVVNRIN